MPPKRGKKAASGAADEVSAETLVARLSRAELEKLVLGSMADHQPIDQRKVEQALPAAKRQAKIARVAVAAGELRSFSGPFQRLSLELHLSIIAGSCARTIMNVLCTCTGWRSLAEQPALWRILHLSTYQPRNMGLPKHALRVIVPYLARLNMLPHVRDLTLQGEWEHAKDINLAVKAFTEVEVVTLSGRKFKDAVLKTASTHWSKLRVVRFEDTKAELAAKLQLIAANHSIISIELDRTQVDAQLIQQLGLATLRDGGSSILQRLTLEHTGYGWWDSLTLNKSISVWNCIGAQLPELTSLTIQIVIKRDDPDPFLQSTAAFPALSRLEQLKLTLKMSNRYGEAATPEQLALNSKDQTALIEGFLARLLPACPRLVDLEITFREYSLTNRESRAGIKQTPSPTPPDVMLWAPQLKHVAFTGSWA